jgi:tetratricopeptide (TPR) repeat protein
MSLLMDALKRAEEAKRQQATRASQDGGKAAAPSDGIPLDPLTDERGQDSGLPDLQLHQDAVDKDLRDTADFVELTLTKPTESANQARVAAQNIFLAKVPSPSDEAQRQRKSMFLIIGAGCLAGLGIAGYVWYQLQAVAGSSGLLRATSPADARGAQGSGIVTSAAAPLPVLPGRESKALARVPATGIAPAAGDTLAAGSTRLPPRSDVTREARIRAPRPAPRQASAPSGPAPLPDKHVAISAGKVTESLVVRAYSAWQGGKVDAARSLYGEALADDPNNVDALLGAATVAAYDGNRPRTETLFSRALDIDPRNAAAHAGLLALRGPGDVSQTESRFKTLLAQSSDQAASGALHFSLGNLYAEQRRWREAQQAYFRAHVSDADNPDYAFNLAVSLDQLEQRAPARKYYGLALQLVARRPGAFDRQAAEARLSQLAP